MLCAEYKHASHQFHMVVISHAAAKYYENSSAGLDMHVCTVLYCSMKVYVDVIIMQ